MGADRSRTDGPRDVEGGDPTVPSDVPRIESFWMPGVWNFCRLPVPNLFVLTRAKDLFGLGRRFKQPPDPAPTGRPGSLPRPDRGRGRVRLGPGGDCPRHEGVGTALLPAPDQRERGG